MKTELIYARSNAMKLVLTIDVLFEIHAMISKATVFDGIHEN